MKYIRNIIAVIVFQILKLRFSLLQVKNTDTKNVLFVNLGLLGDVVMSTILFTNECRLNKDYKITFILDEKYVALFTNYHGEITIKFINVTKYKRSITYRLELLNKLFHERFIKVFNLSFGRLAIDDEISLISGLNGQTYAFVRNKNLKRLFVSLFENSYSHIFVRFEGSDIVNFAEIIKFISEKPAVVDFSTKIFLHEEDILTKFELEKNNYFVIAPYARVNVKNWPFANYLKICAKLNHISGIKCLFVGDKDFSSNDLDNGIINLMGKTGLVEVCNLIKESSFFIGNDSGLLHIAIARTKNVMVLLVEEPMEGFTHILKATQQSTFILNVIVLIVIGYVSLMHHIVFLTLMKII